MAYSTAAAMIARYSEGELIQLTDRADPPTGAVVTAVIDQALDGASAEIDSYLGARYGTLLGTDIPVLKDACETLARERLFEDRATAVVMRDADRVRRWLRDLADARASLPLSGDEAGAVIPGPVTYQAGSRVFTRDTMADF